MFAAVMAAMQAIAALPKIISEVKDSLDKFRESQLQQELQEIRSDVNEICKQIENASTKEERLALSFKLANAVRR